MYYTFYLIIISIAILLPSCIDRHHNPQLEKVSDLIESAPLVALDSLEKINHGTLDNEDRHYYDFLSIKASDKAYIPHKSDSLILSVIDYYSSDKNNPLYIESLYYAGRVYSDKGDKKTAFIYFQKALELLPEKSYNVRLRSRILSQSGRLLISLRLYERALPYLREAIKVNENRKDTINLFFNNQLLGSSLMHDNRFDSAFIYIRRAYDLSKTLSVSHRAFIRMYMAAVNINSGNIDSALYYIRPYTIDSIWPDEKSLALSYAADIYLNAGIQDTAYMYAKELINSNDSLNKKTGFRLLLFTELEKYIPHDSLKYYYKEYRNVLDKYYNNRENDAAILQYTQYNYDFHEHKRIQTEKTNKILEYGILMLALCILAAIPVYIWQSYRINKQQLMLLKMLLVIKKLKSALPLYKPDNLDLLPTVFPVDDSICQGATSSNINDEDNSNVIFKEENNLESSDNICMSEDTSTSDKIYLVENISMNENTEVIEDLSHSQDTKVSSNKDDLSNLETTLISTEINRTKILTSIQKSLRTELLALYDPEISIALDERIRTSKEYEFLEEAICSVKVIDEDAAFWKELREVVCKSAPHFMERLTILTGNKLTHKDIQTALLIKCGISHSHMSVIFGRTKGTISQRKETLSRKIFGCKVDMKILEQIVRIL